MLEKLWEVVAASAAKTGFSILYAIIVFIVGRKLIKWIMVRIKKSKASAKIDDSLQSFLYSFLTIVLNVVLLVTVAVILGIPTTSFLTIIASAGVAIGLALQGALSNFAGGVMILLFKPFRVGDYIKNETYEGTVKEITVFYTKLVTLDNKMVTLPNGNLTNSAITNYSAEPMRRVDVDCCVSYDSDIDEVKGVLLGLAKKHDLVKKDPEAVAVLLVHNESSLDFQLRAWCDTQDYWTVKFDLSEEIKKAFDANGIKIPFAQMDVHIDDLRDKKE